jgi:hypothetical protein
MDLAMLELVEVRSREEMRELIVELQRQINKHPDRDDPKDYPIRHHFAPGVYAREVTIPAGKVVVGEIHKTRHLNILSKGKITVWTDEGMKTLEAPFTLTSNPGTKRVGLTHSEVVWTTIHPTDETDIQRLQEQLIAKDFSEVEFSEKPQLKEGA